MGDITILLFSLDTPACSSPLRFAHITGLLSCGWLCIDAPGFVAGLLTGSCPCLAPHRLLMQTVRRCKS